MADGSSPGAGIACGKYATGARQKSIAINCQSDPPRSRLLSTAIAVLAHERLARKKLGNI